MSVAAGMLSLLVFLPLSAEPATAVSQAAVEQKILAYFNELTTDIAVFERRAAAECYDRFPAGAIFSHVLLANAYSHLAMRGDDTAEGYLLRAAELLEGAVRHVERDVKVPPGGLVAIKSYRAMGVPLGQLNMALGLYRLAGGDDRFDEVRANLSAVLRDALMQARGRPLMSYPGLAYPFDTIPPVVSLAIQDELVGEDLSTDAIRQHLAWIAEQGTDPMTGLPWSRVTPHGLRGTDPARGCDLSWRVALLSDVDPEGTRDLYERYAAAYWLERPPLMGFAEWRGGESRKMDADSGPIVAGIGGSASGFGLAATKAMGDNERHSQLLGQLGAMPLLVAAVTFPDPRTGEHYVAGLGKYDPQATTGFLYGDICLFYALTWEPWLRKQP